MSEIDILLRVKVDKSQLEKDLANIERRSGLEIVPKVDTDIFQKELKKLEINPILVPVELNTSNVEKQLKTMAKDFSDRNLLLDVGIDRKALDPLFKDFKKQLNKTELKPKVDHSELTELNKHLELKKTHLDEVNTYFAANPLKVAYDRDSANSIAKDIQAIKAEFKDIKDSSSSPVNFKVNSDTNSFEKTIAKINLTKQELEELKKTAREDVKVEVIVDPEVFSKIKEEITTADEKLGSTAKAIKDTATKPFEKQVPTDDKYIQAQINAAYTSAQGLELDSSIGSEISGTINSNSFITNNFLKSIFTEAVLIRKEAKAIANKSDKTLAITAKVSALDMGDIALSVARLDFGRINNQQEESEEETKEIDELDKSIERLRVTFNQQINEIEQELRDQITPLVVELERVAREVFKLSIPLKKSNQLIRTGNITTKQALLLVKSTLDVGFNEIKSLLKSIDNNISGYNIDALFTSLMSNVRNELTRGFAASFARSFFNKTNIDPREIGRAGGENVGEVAKFGLDIAGDLNKDIINYFKEIFKRLEVEPLGKEIDNYLSKSILQALTDSTNIQEFIANLPEKLSKNFSSFQPQLSKTAGKAANLKTYLSEASYRSRATNPVNDVFSTALESTLKNALTTNIGKRISPIIDRSLKERREKGLEIGQEKVLKRAQEIFAKNVSEIGKFKQNLETTKEGKKKNLSIASQEAPTVISPETKELYITVGGYARDSTASSGIRIAGDIASKTGEETSAIGIRNPDTDLNPETLGNPVSTQQNILKSLAKPNLRGYSEDAVEMAAQALSALMVNPEIKIKFVGESGGGFVAEEATKLMQMLGYEKQVEGAAFGTPNLIGGLNPKNYKKFISKDESVGIEAHKLYAPFGLADVSKPEQNIEGVKKHPYENYRPTKEYRKFIEGEYKLQQSDIEALNKQSQILKDNLLKGQINPKDFEKEIKKILKELEVKKYKANVEEEKQVINKYLQKFKGLLDLTPYVSSIIEINNFLENANKQTEDLMLSGATESISQLPQIVSDLTSIQIELIRGLTSNSEEVYNESSKLLAQIKDIKETIGTLNIPDTRVYQFRYIKKQAKDYYSKEIENNLNSSESGINAFINQIDVQQKALLELIQNSEENVKQEFQELYDFFERLKQKSQKILDNKKKKSSRDSEPPTEPPSPSTPKKPKPKPPSGGGTDEEEPPSPIAPKKPKPKPPSGSGGGLAQELSQALDINIKPIIDGINQSLDKIAVEAGESIGKSTAQALEARFIFLLQKNIQASFKQSLLEVMPKVQAFSAESIRQNITQSLQPPKQIAEVEPDNSIQETIKSLQELKEIAATFREVAKLAKESVRLKEKEAYAISAANTADEFIQEIDKYIQSLTKEERTKTREGILSANVKSQISRVQNDVEKVLAQVRADLAEVEGEAISELKALIKEIRQFFITQKNILKQEIDKVSPEKIEAARKVATAAEPTTTAMEEIKQSEKLSPKIANEVKATKSQITQASNIVGIRYNDIKKEADRVAKEYEKVGKNALEGLEIGAKIEEAKELGEKIGKALETGTKDSLDTQSPSKKYIKIGEDIVKGLEIGSFGIINVIRTIDRQITSLTPRVSEAIGQAREIRDELEQNINQRSQEIGQNIQSATQQVQQSAAEIGENIQYSERTARVRQAGQETLEEFQNLNNSFSNFVRQIQQNLGGIQNSEEILEEAINSTSGAGDSEQRIQNIFNRVGQAISTGFQIGVSTLRPILERVDRDLLEFGFRTYNAISTIFDIFDLIEPIFSQLSQIIQNQLLDLNKNFEDALALKNIKNLIKGFSSDAEAEFKRLVKAANTYGQDLRKIAETSISFDLSFQGTALEGNTQKLTEDLFQGLSAFNPSSEKFDQAMTALNQIASKGVVSMEELRQQLSEALPGALSIAARSMNLTQQEFNNLVSSGNLLSEEFLPKFAAQLKAETFTAFIANSQSAASSLGTLKNEIFLTSAAMGEAYVNLGKPFFEIITNALRTVKENLHIIGAVFQAAFAWNVLQLGKFIGRIVIATGVLNGGIAGAIASLKVMGGVISTVGKLILKELGAIALVAATIGFTIDTFKLLTGGGNEFTDSLEESQKITQKLTQDLDDAFDKLNKIRKEQGKPIIVRVIDETKDRKEDRTTGEVFNEVLFGDSPQASGFWAKGADAILNILNGLPNEQTAKQFDLPKPGNYFGELEQANTQIAAYKKLQKIAKQTDLVSNAFGNRNQREQAIKDIIRLQDEIQNTKVQLTVETTKTEIDQEEIDRLKKELKQKTTELSTQNEIVFPLGGVTGLKQIKQRAVEERAKLQKLLTDQNFKEIQPQIDAYTNQIKLIDIWTNRVAEDTAKITEEYKNLANKVILLNRELQNAQFDLDLKTSKEQLELYRQELNSIISPKELELKLKLSEIEKTKTELDILQKGIKKKLAIAFNDLRQQTKTKALGVLNLNIDPEKIKKQLFKEITGESNLGEISIDSPDLKFADLEQYLSDEELKGINQKVKSIINKALGKLKPADIDAAIEILDRSTSPLSSDEKKLLGVLKEIGEAKKEEIELETSLIGLRKDANKLGLETITDELDKNKELLQIKQNKLKLDLLEKRKAGQISQTEFDRATGALEIDQIKEKIALKQQEIKATKEAAKNQKITVRDAITTEEKLTSELFALKSDLFEKEKQKREEIISLREESLQLIDLEVKKNQNLLTSYDRLGDTTLGFYDKLLNAQKELADARTSLGEAQDTGEIQRLEKAIDLRKTLADDNASFKDKQKARSQLRSLGIYSNTRQLKQQQANLQDKADLNRLKSLKEQQKANLQLLEIDRARETIAAKRAIAEAKTGQLEATSNLLQARLEAERALISGDDRKIKIAKLGLEIARQELGISQQKIDDAKQALAVERRITKLKLEANKKQNAAELLRTVNDIRLNNPDLLVPQRKRAKLPEDYQPVVDIRLPGGKKLDISEYQNYLKPKPAAVEEIEGLSDVRINPKFEENIKPENFKPIVDIRLPNGQKLDISEYQNYLKPQVRKGVERDLLNLDRSGDPAGIRVAARFYPDLPQYSDRSLSQDLKQIFKEFSPIADRDLNLTDPDLTRSVSRLSDIFPELGDLQQTQNLGDRRTQELADRLSRTPVQQLDDKTTYVKSILDTNTAILGKVSDLLETVKAQPSGQIQINNTIDSEDSQARADEITNKTLSAIVDIFDRAAG